MQDANWRQLDSGWETVIKNYDSTKAIKTRLFRDPKLSSLLSLVQQD